MGLNDSEIQRMRDKFPKDYNPQAAFVLWDQIKDARTAERVAISFRAIKRRMLWVNNKWVSKKWAVAKAERILARLTLPDKASKSS